MSTAAVALNEIEADATTKSSAADGEDLMSSLKSAIAIRDTETETTAEVPVAAKPVLVPKSGRRPDNRITSRVEAALDVEFANGSMPA
jgi:hypothetical protein